MERVQAGYSRLSDLLTGSFFELVTQADGSLSSRFPNGNIITSVCVGMFVVFKRHHPGPQQGILTFHDSCQNGKQGFCLKTNSLLALIIEGPVKSN
jgi:hypothetical protein